jgi:dihydroorotate dehydrogenase electron transfer subunit
LVLLTANNNLRTTQIIRIQTESPTVKTFTFTDKLCSKANPGQFLMLWIPGIDEIPLSIMNAGNDLVSVSVKALGDATRHMHALETGATIGLRGPFGTSFTESRGRVLLVGGGTGTAPLLFLANRLASKTQRLSFVEGAGETLERAFVVMGEPLASATLVQRLRDYLGVKATAPEAGGKVAIEL